MYYVGLDIGGTAIKAGLVDENNHVLESRKAPTIVDDLKGFVSKLTELIRIFQKSAAIDAVGIGVPGLRSSKTHCIETSPNISCLKNINLEELLADEVHLKVISENGPAGVCRYGTLAWYRMRECDQFAKRGNDHRRRRSHGLR